MLTRRHRWTLRKEKEIAVAHSLDLNYDSKCINLHGHNLTVIIEIEVESLTVSGMVIDAMIVGKIIDRFDHQHLNGLPEFENIPTTMENIAMILGDKVRGNMGGFDNKITVTIRETAGNQVTLVIGGP